MLARLLTRGVEHTTAGMAAGAIALAGGLAGLGLLPDAEPVWTLAPQALIGVGIALTLPGLTGRALAGRDPAGHRAAGTIAARHVGIVLGLVVLTPLFSAELPDQQVAAERSGTALILEAPLAPKTKIELGEAIAEQIGAAGAGFPTSRPRSTTVTPAPEARPAYAELQEQLTGELDKAATHAFSTVFLIAAGLALLALLPIAVSGAGGAGGAALGGRRGGGAGRPGVGGGRGRLSGARRCRPISRARSRTRARRDRSRSSAPRDGGLLAADRPVGARRCGVPPAGHARGAGARAREREARRKAFIASHRITDAGLEDAVRDGARRAIADEQRLGSISSLEASLLDRAVGAVPVSTLLDALQSSSGTQRHRLPLGSARRNDG